MSSLFSHSYVSGVLEVVNVNNQSRLHKNFHIIINKFVQIKKIMQKKYCAHEKIHDNKKQWLKKNKITVHIKI